MADKKGDKYTPSAIHMEHREKKQLNLHLHRNYLVIHRLRRNISW